MKMDDFGFTNVEKERLVSLVNNLPEGALFQFVRDCKTGEMYVSYASGRGKEVTGIAAEDTASNMDTLFAIVYPDDLPLVIQTIESSILTMNSIQIEFRINVQGNIRWIKLSSRPHVDDTLIYLGRYHHRYYPAKKYRTRIGNRKEPFADAGRQFTGKRALSIHP